MSVDHNYKRENDSLESLPEEDSEVEFRSSEVGDSKAFMDSDYTGDLD